MARTWVVADNLGARLTALRRHLGERQAVFGHRFGRGWKQVSKWEHGQQLPAAAVLERAARDNGWPLEIFAEGGPMPGEALPRPVAARSSPKGPSDYPPAVIDLSRDPGAYTLDRAYALVALELSDAMARGAMVNPERALRLAGLVYEVARRELAGRAPLTPPKHNGGGGADARAG